MADNESSKYAAMKYAAITIRDEVEDGRNTAQRVGGVLVNMADSVAESGGVSKSLVKSFNNDILGRIPLIDIALYDEQVDAEIADGLQVVLTAREESTGWPNYGVKLPETLTHGQTYTIKGFVHNKTEQAIGVGNYPSLYPEDADPHFWLVYNLAANSRETINKTFVYDANYPYLTIGKSNLHYVGDRVIICVYIVQENARLPQAEENIETLQGQTAQNADNIAGVASAQDSIYTDIYGKKRMKEGQGYDAQVAITTDGDSVKFQSVEASTGWPNYGLRLPETLVNGNKYRLRGTIANHSSTPVSVGNYSSLYPEDETQGFWATYNLPVGQTAEIDVVFTYNQNKPYLTIGKSQLPQVGDYVTMTLNVESGENIVGRLSALEGEEGASCVITSLFPNIKATDGSLLTFLQSGENTGWAMTQESGGVRLVAQGQTGNYMADGLQFYPAYRGIFKPATKYAVFTDIESEPIPLRHEQDILDLSFFFIKQDFTQNSAAMRISQGEILNGSRTRSLQAVSFIETGAASGEFQYVNLRVSKVNASHSTDKLTNILIKRFIIFEVTPAYANYSALDFVALLKNAGTFESLAVVAAAKSRHANLLYDGLKLKSLGDSLPETTSFQPYIAQALGMTYDAAEELNDDGNYKRSALGGSRVVPVVWNTSGGGAAGNSIYMRARSLAHWSPDVLIILAGYNDTHAGDAYIDGGMAIAPADYGINDAAYTGGEIDLLTTPSASVPSFGASYRGMLNRILTDMPWIRIVLCGIPRGSGEVSLIGTDADWVAKKNAVIERIAAEYGFPFVDLSKVYGVNSYNYGWLTKDGLHFSDYGGRRVAMEIMAKAF